jgi:hypothetical protein
VLTCVAVLTAAMPATIGAQTPAPRIGGTTARKAQAQSQITAIRNGAAQYDQALAAIGRTATAPVASLAQINAVVATLKSSLAVIKTRLNDRLLQIAITDASLKRGVDTAARQKDARGFTNLRTSVDRIGGVSTLRATLNRRVQEDAQTLKRTADALQAKSRSAGPGADLLASAAASIRAAMDTIVESAFPSVSAQIPEEGGKTAQDPVLVLAVLIVASILEDVIEGDKGVSDFPSLPSLPPLPTIPLPSPAERDKCFTDVEARFDACMTNAGNDVFKRIACTAKWVADSALCLVK